MWYKGGRALKKPKKQAKTKYKSQKRRLVKMTKIKELVYRKKTELDTPIVSYSDVEPVVAIRDKNGFVVGLLKSDEHSWGAKSYKPKKGSPRASVR